MSKQSSGGCLCGASAFTVAIYTDENDFQIDSGELATYSKVADSGRSLGGPKGTFDSEA